MGVHEAGRHHRTGLPCDASVVCAERGEDRELGEGIQGLDLGGGGLRRGGPKGGRKEGLEGPCIGRGGGARGCGRLAGGRRGLNDVRAGCGDIGGHGDRGQGRDEVFGKGVRELGRCRCRSLGGQGGGGGGGGDRGNGDLLGIGTCEKRMRAMSEV